MEENVLVFMYLDLALIIWTIRVDFRCYVHILIHIFFCLCFFHLQVVYLNNTLNLFYYLFGFLLALYLQFHYVLLAKINFYFPMLFLCSHVCATVLEFAKAVLSNFSFYTNVYLALIQYFLTWLFESCSFKFEVIESHCTWIYLYLNLTKMCLCK